MSTMRQDDPARELEDRLLRRVHESFGIVIPSPDVDLLESGLVDSLTFVELLVLVEREFGVGVELAELDLDDFRSVRRITAFVTRRTAGTNGTG